MSCTGCKLRRRCHSSRGHVPARSGVPLRGHEAAPFAPPAQGNEQKTGPSMFHPSSTIAPISLWLVR